MAKNVSRNPEGQRFARPTVYDYVDDNERMLLLKETNAEEKLLKQRGLKITELSWTGPGPFPDTGQQVTVSGTYGSVCFHGIKENPETGKLERAVWVKTVDGSLIKACGTEVEPLTEEIQKSIDERNRAFRDAIKVATKQIETEVKERRIDHDRSVEAMVSLARTRGLTVEEKSTIFKVTGQRKGAAVYVLKKGGRVDLSGFCVERAGVTPLSEEDAKQRHLGRVRGQIVFTPGNDVGVMEAYEEVIAKLQE